MPKGSTLTRLLRHNSTLSELSHRKADPAQSRLKGFRPPMDLSSLLRSLHTRVAREIHGETQSNLPQKRRK